MLYLLRLLVVLAMCGGFAVQMIGVLWEGFKTGKMPYADSSSRADRRKQPLLFWFLALVFGIFALAALFIIYAVMMEPTRETFSRLEGR